MNEDDKALSSFRQALEENRKELESYFKGIIDSTKEENENDFDLTQIAEQSASSEERTANKISSFNSKLNELLNLQNNMLLEIKGMNNKINSLSNQQSRGNSLAALALMGMAPGLIPRNTGDGSVPPPGNNTRVGDNNTITQTREGTIPTRVQPLGNTIRERIEALEANTEFTEVASRIEQRFGLTRAEHYAIIRGESSFRPDIISPQGGYGGLYQMGLGTTGLGGQYTSQQIAEMSPLEQILLYEKMLENQLGEDFDPTKDEARLGMRQAAPALADWEGDRDLGDWVHPTRGDRPYGIGGRYWQANPGWRTSPEGPITPNSVERYYMRYAPSIQSLLEELELRDNTDVTSESQPEPTRISGDQFIRGHLKEMGVAEGDENDEGYKDHEVVMTLYNPTMSGQQGSKAVHGAGYIGASNAVRAYWTKEQLEAAGLSAGENTVQLTNPITGELETVNINIQSFDGGNNFATTDFIGTGTLGESREYWNPDLNQAQSIVQNLGGSLGDLDRRKKLNEYIQRNEGITIPYSEVDVPGPEDARPYPVEAADQGGRINKYVSENFEPVEQQIPTENIEPIIRKGETRQRRTDRLSALPNLYKRFDAGEFEGTATQDFKRELELRTPTEAPTEPRRRESTETGPTSKATPMSKENQRIEANTIKRFPWANKLIKYYNLGSLIKTNVIG